MLAVRRDQGTGVHIHDVISLLDFLKVARAPGVEAESLGELHRRMDGSNPLSARVGALSRGLGLRTYERPHARVEKVAQGLRVSEPGGRAILVQVDPEGRVTSWTSK